MQTNPEHCTNAARGAKGFVADASVPEPLWVARLEILADRGARAEFLATVRLFVDIHPDSPHFAEIVRLWRRFPRIA